MEDSVSTELVELTLMRRKLVRVMDTVSRIFTNETVDYSWEDLQRLGETLESKLPGLVVEYSHDLQCYVLVPRVFCL